MSVLFAVLASF